MRTLCTSLLFAAFLIAGNHLNAQSQKIMSSDADLTEVAMKTQGFEQLVGALKQAGLVSALQAEGPFTVFAPQDAAFEAIADKVAALNDEQLATVLKYHVVPGNLMATDVVKAIQDNKGAVKVKTLTGEEITVMMKQGKVIIKDKSGDSATVLKTDVKASNGVIHVIDRVLLP